MRPWSIEHALRASGLPHAAAAENYVRLCLGIGAPPPLSSVPPEGDPLRRHSALIPLSHDHHAELVQARRLRLASGSDVAEARVAAAEQYVAAFFTETTSHFRVEEEKLFPLLSRGVGSSPLLGQVLSEHQELRGLASALREEAARGDVGSETMLRIADLLESNVRREERELFPLIEETVSDAVLRALDLPSSVTAASDG
jgi:hemerythrin-like domain-containing protein